MRIENWEVEDIGLGNKWVVGNVHGHPGYPEGHYIHTSRIVQLDLTNRSVKTLNSTYQLGTPRGGDAGAVHES